MSGAEGAAASTSDSISIQNQNMKFEDGVWTCQNEETGIVYTYCEESKQWIIKDGQKNDQNSAPPAADNPNMECIEGVYVSRDPRFGLVSYYDYESSQWIAQIRPEKKPDEDIDNDDDAEDDGDDGDDEFSFQLKQEHLEKRRLELEKKKRQENFGPNVFVHPTTGTIFDWQTIAAPDGSNWTPRVDDDFIARYQANYGSTVAPPQKPSPSVEEKPGKSKEEIEKEELKEKLAGMDPKERKDFMRQQRKEKRKLAEIKASEKKWFEIDDEHNTNVYVSGLPLDVTLDEFVKIMSKCGLVARDPLTNAFKAKLYKEPDGTIKGDGRCCYIKRESVDLALSILDGSTVREKKIKVEQAHFEMKGDSFDPTKKKRKLTNRQKKDFLKKQEKLFDWRPEKMVGERPKNEATVVLKNAFTIEEFSANAARLIEVQDALREEAAKYGQLKKLRVFENNPEGVISVTFSSAEEADDFLTMMDFKVFLGRKLRAERWDGQTKYAVKETASEEMQRIESWHKFLEKDTGVADEQSEPEPKQNDE